MTDERPQPDHNTPTPEEYHAIFANAINTMVQGRRIRTLGFQDLTSYVKSYVESVKASPTGLAAAMIAIRQMSEALAEAQDTINKTLGAIKTTMLPQLFDDQKTKTVTVEVYGVAYRVSVAELMRASIKSSETDPDIRSKAYQWLRDNGLDELITETVNASTLSATAKSLIEEGKELDPDLFNVAVMPSVSVTKVAEKAKKTKKEE